MFDWLKKASAIDPESEKARLMELSEKELLVEMILELKRISEKCDEIGRKIVIWSNWKLIRSKQRKRFSEGIPPGTF